MKNRGFTLLEVLVAVTILGLGLTMILSSQAGLFASTRRVQHETVATNLLRCKMTELELELLTLGFPLIEQNDSGDCCADEDEPGYSCSWKIETVELPQPATMTENADGKTDPSKASATDPLAALGAAPAGANTGPLGVLSDFEKGGGLSEGSSPEDLASSFASSSPGGPGGIAAMAMSFIYPSLKPMLEASIRKLTVKVAWREGEKERDFSVVQFITSPREGSLNPNDPNALAAAAAGSGAPGSPAAPGSSGTPSSGNNSPGASK